MATPIERLIQEYASEAYVLERYRKSLDSQKPLEAEEAKTVSGMISDMHYALIWMRQGRRPGNRRGAEQMDVYRQREIYAELQPVQDEDKQRLATQLLGLSSRERLCFLLHFARGLTQEEISARLGVSRSSVRKFIDRAKTKVNQGF